MTAEACQKLHVFEMGFLGQILGVTRRDRVRNLDIKKQLNIEWDIVNRTQTRRLHYFAHVDYHTEPSMPDCTAQDPQEDQNCSGLTTSLQLLHCHDTQ